MTPPLNLNLEPIAPALTPGRPLVIAGPCSAESREQVLTVARAMAVDGRAGVFRAGVWKPRTRPGGFEGIGVAALPWLAEVKRVTGMPVATEVATRVHVEEALAAGVDILWIGARTSVNPFAVQEIADTLSTLGRTDVTVLVKNPVNPDLELWIGAIQRFYNAGVRRLAAVHRGFSSYGEHLYRNPPQWHIAIELRRRVPGLPVICDPSHIAGHRALVGDVAAQAINMGLDGLMIETHCNPDSALSDMRQQLLPGQLSALLDRVLAPSGRDGSLAPGCELEQLRGELDGIDDEIISLIDKRMRVCRHIGEYKVAHGMAVLQMERHSQVMEAHLAMARTLGISEEFMSQLVRAIHEESVRQQLAITARLANHE